MTTTKYYKVTTYRGHQGRGKIVPITFYIAAQNAMHASKIAQRMPGIKHSRMVMSCVPISIEEYMEGRKLSAYKRANGIRDY